MIHAYKPRFSTLVTSLIFKRSSIGPKMFFGPIIFAERNVPNRPKKLGTELTMHCIQSSDSIEDILRF